MPNAIFFPLPTGERLTGWRDRLVRSNALVADAVQQVRRDFYDSFDGRLSRTGTMLEHERGAHGGELRLRVCDGQRVRAALAWDTEVPRFPAALAPGELRRVLEKRLGPRALLPLASVRLRRFNLRAVDAEDKTRVRVRVESLGLRDSQGRFRVLRKHLCVQPLRGYSKDAQRIVSCLEQDHGLRPLCADLCALILTAAGSHPLDNSAVRAVSLRADMRADAAARRVLQAQLADMQAQEPGLIADLDSEFLHDFRIAVRRSRSLLGELKRLFPRSVQQRFGDDFAWLSAVTSEARDLDVYLLNFAAYRRAVPARLRPGLDPLQALLRDKRQRVHSEQLAVQLQSRRYRAFKQRWQDYLDRPLARRPTAPEAAKPLGAVVRRRSWRRYRRILRQGARIGPESPAEELHGLRKACKKLRYLLDSFAALYPPADLEAAIRILKKLQNNLGEIQDLEVQGVALNRFAMELRRRGEYNANTGAAVAALLETLQRRKTQAREAFETRFRRFARAGNQRLFRRLLKPESAEPPR